MCGNKTHSRTHKHTHTLKSINNEDALLLRPSQYRWICANIVRHTQHKAYFFDLKFTAEKFAAEKKQLHLYIVETKITALMMPYTHANRNQYEHFDRYVSWPELNCLVYANSS